MALTTTETKTEYVSNVSMSDNKVVIDCSYNNSEKGKAWVSSAKQNVMAADIFQGLPRDLASHVLLFMQCMKAEAKERKEGQRKSDYSTFAAAYTAAVEADNVRRAEYKKELGESTDIQKKLD